MLIASDTAILWRVSLKFKLSLATSRFHYDVASASKRGKISGAFQYLGKKMENRESGVKNREKIYGKFRNLVKSPSMT